MKKFIKLFSLIFICSAIMFSFSSCFYMDILSAERFKAIDEDTINFIQFDALKQGDETATISTSIGDIKIKLFAEQSPNAVANFKQLVEEGYYTNYKVTTVSTDKSFIATDSNGGGKSIYDKPFDNQYSDNLWHFPGAVSSISDKEAQGDSRFLIVAQAQISEDIFAQMVQSHFPKKVIEKYREVGGAPEYDRGCNIFAQVYEGMEIVNKISAIKTDDKGKPTEDIIINSISLSTIE